MSYQHTYQHTYLSLGSRAKPVEKGIIRLNIT
ncbi:MAG: hypothetical protein JWP09_29 [Candidatus Taylorbacteria bacterium]|nr:hypothetical protein [Candidatus Taylorbacteria bacterium]